MVDEMVVRAQKFVNTYNVAGIPTLAEDGHTGWVVVHALTRVLQYELGIKVLSNSFGAATLDLLARRYPIVNNDVHHAAVIRVLQSALYCKGYAGGLIDGVYNSQVASSVDLLKEAAGVEGAYPEQGVSPKLFQALLTMDAYRTMPGGSPQVADVQRWLNSRYVLRRDFSIVPCDGFYSRGVQRGVMLALQYELGLSDNDANGVLGPKTMAGLRAHNLGEGSSGVWVQLLSAALVFNQVAGARLRSVFNATMATQVGNFQDFVCLPVTRYGDYQTWCSLLVSTGDPTRQGRACDCVTEVTSLRAEALKKAGYQIVGRYLSNALPPSLNKMIQPRELSRLSKNGLRVFPVFQLSGNTATYFSSARGRTDAFQAIEWARYHGFKRGTIIYFAVDLDALDEQITTNVAPYFNSVAAVIEEFGIGYRVGVYGPRNVCSRVALHVSACFVSDMSRGYSGNLGFSMPQRWAFDQISTRTIGSGASSIQVDNNIASGLDRGQSQFDPSSGRPPGLDVDFDMTRRAAMLSDVRAYLSSIGVPERGGPGKLNGTVPFNSTGESFDVVMSFDSTVTQLARRLAIRKSLIQTPLLWELRHFNLDDPVADSEVIRYYNGRIRTGARPDCSTGLGAIFAKTAIEARNHCILQFITDGEVMSSTSETNLWFVWQKLHDSAVYNISTIPLVLIHAAYMIKQSRPGLGYSDAHSQQVLARYNGVNALADVRGREMVGLYQTFQRHNMALVNG